jgi:hypothetical protein
MRVKSINASLRNTRLKACPEHLDYRTYQLCDLVRKVIVSNNTNPNFAKQLFEWCRDADITYKK